MRLLDFDRIICTDSQLSERQSRIYYPIYYYNTRLVIIISNLQDAKNCQISISELSQAREDSI